MRSYDPGNRRNQKPYFPSMPYLLGQEAEHADAKKNQGKPVVMMLAIAMQQGMQTHGKGQRDHTVLK